MIVKKGGMFGAQGDLENCARDRWRIETLS
jgi:hypothetical protein